MQSILEKRVQELNLVEVVVEDASHVAETNQEAFAMLRRAGFGASDSSVLLGVNLYKDLDTLLAEKRSVCITEEELAIGNKVNVRKGRDLEPLILSKAEHFLGMVIEKPSAMYRLREEMSLTINYDGIAELGNSIIPVEAKFVSSFAGKYWNPANCIKKFTDLAGAKSSPIVCAYHKDIEEHIKLCAEDIGIPAYYYTQVQQQLLGVNAPFGVLAALFEKDWELYTFAIPKDVVVQTELKKRASVAWDLVKPEVV